MSKQNNRIIETFEATQKNHQQKKTTKPLKTWKLELSKLANGAKKLRGSSDSPAIHSPAFGLVKASIEFAQLAESDPEDVDQLYMSLKKLERALKKSWTVLERQDDW